MDYQFLPGLFLRTPFYSSAGYDLAGMESVLALQTFRNAVYLASPVFHRALEKKEFNLNLLSDKEKHTLFKYYNRMCFRPTPFGSFSAFTLLKWGPGTPVRLAGDERARVHLLPDQAVMAGLNRYLSARNTLTLNPALYIFGEEVRFVRSVPDLKGRLEFSLDNVALIPFYTGLVGLFNRTGVDRQQLVAWIGNETGCSGDDAADTLQFLLDAQIIFDGSREVLITPNRAAPLHADIRATIAAESDLRAFAHNWKDHVPLLSPAEDRSCFYAAAERPLESGDLGQELQQEISSALKVLGLLRPPAVQPALEKYIRDFQLRFELEKVPLLLALDPDAGVAYGGEATDPAAAALLDGIGFQPDGGAAGPPVSWEGVRRLFFRLWAGKEKAAFEPIELKDEDLQGLDSPSAATPLPSTLAVVFRMTAGNLLIESVGGVTANAVMGRFSEFSENIHDLCLEIAAKEKAAHPDILFADIGQATDLHTDNMNRRRQIYEHEIPVNVRSGLDPDSRIPLSDLLLSVRDGQLILESQSRNQRVIPRLATAYNFHDNGLNIFRLLADLQYQGLARLRGLDLEELFPGLNFYPGVRYGSTVICLAKWKFSADELSGLTGPAALGEFRRAHRLPHRISMGRSDQLLVYDLTDPDEACFFIASLKGLKSTTLFEYLPPGRTVRKGFQPMTAQFVAFLWHGKRIYRSYSAPGALQDPGKKRRFLTGSEWLYLKIFCTPLSADKILAGTVAPFLAGLPGKDLTWFFIRYTENGYHLRLRVRLGAGDTGRVLSAFAEQLRSSGNESLVRDLRSDTYNREMERYGAELIDQVEELFCQGSELVLRFVALQQEDRTGWTPFRLAMVTSYLMILVYDGDTGSAVSLAARMAESFVAEFGGSKALRLGLDRKFRALRPDIAAWLKNLSGSSATTGEDLPMAKLLMQIGTIRFKTQHYPQEDKERLLADLVHMQLNRTFRSDPRRQELLVYYCLHKYFLSVRARDGR